MPPPTVIAGNDVRARGGARGLRLANRAHVAVYVGELTSRPHRRGVNVVAIGSRPANATNSACYRSGLLVEGFSDSYP